MRAWLPIALFLTLSGCGQQGPLYLPEAPPPPPMEAPQTEDAD